MNETPLNEHLKHMVDVPRSATESAALRSVRAQYKEKTNVDLDEGVALGWVREARG